MSARVVRASQVASCPVGPAGSEGSAEPRAPGPLATIVCLLVRWLELVNRAPRLRQETRGAAPVRVRSALLRGRGGRVQFDPEQRGFADDAVRGCGCAAVGGEVGNPAVVAGAPAPGGAGRAGQDLVERVAGEVADLA